MLEQNYIEGKTSVKIAGSVEREIAAGRIAAGSLLPPVRHLAVQLSVSPATVAAAYKTLQLRGVVVGNGRQGTAVRQAPQSGARHPMPVPEGARDLASGNPDPALLPGLGKYLRRIDASQRLYAEELNDEKLLGLARRQFRDDGIAADHVAVAGGALDAIERIIVEQLRPGDGVAIEDPSFPGIVDLLRTHGINPVAISADDEGMLPAALEKRLRSVSAVILIPRAQNPTGAAITRSRAGALRSMIRRRDILLVEDDHAWRVAGAAHHPVAGNGIQRWAVIRSVSKSLGPDLRLSFVAGDGATIRRLEARQRSGIRWVSHLLQRLVTEILIDPATDRLLASAAGRYSERRDELLAALGAHGIHGRGRSGLNVWIEVRDELSVVQGLGNRGWVVQGGSQYRLESPPAIRVTIADLLPGEATALAADLAAVLSPARRTLAS